MKKRDTLILAVIAFAELIFGLWFIPQATLIIIIFAAALFWGILPLVIKDRVPFWQWRTMVEEPVVPSSNADMKVRYERTVLFGLIEIRQIPDNIVWVVRAHQADPETLIGYQELGTGWRWIWMPELFWFTVSMVTKKPVNLDPTQYSVNTGTGLIHIDMQATIRVMKRSMSAARFAVRATDTAEVLLKGLLTAVANYVTQGKSDLDLIKLPPKELTEMGSRSSQMLNRGFTTGFDGSTIEIGDTQLEYRSFEDWGLQATVRVQNIEASREVMDAISRKSVAVTETETQAEAVKRIERLTALKLDPRWAAILEYVRPLVENFTSSFKIPEFNLSVGAGAAKGGGGNKGGGEDKTKGATEGGKT